MPSLLTGAAGFVGSHLARRLIERGDRVHVIVRPGSAINRIADIADRLVIHRVDLADRYAVQRCVAEVAPRRVFHLAAETGIRAKSVFDDGMSVQKTYLEPTVHLVEALCALERAPDVMVRTGTIAEYGPTRRPFSEDDWTTPTTPYGLGMQETTRALSEMAGTLPFPVVTARLALCYGAGQSRAFLVPALIEACLARRPITLRRPEDRRDLIHVEDAVDALMTIAGQASLDSTIVNVSSGVSHPVKDVAARIAALTGCLPSLVVHQALGVGDVPDELLCCPKRALSQFGWQARITLEDGLRETVASERNLLKIAG